MDEKGGCRELGKRSDKGQSGLQQLRALVVLTFERRDLGRCGKQADVLSRWTVGVNSSQTRELVVALPSFVPSQRTARPSSLGPRSSSSRPRVEMALAFPSEVWADVLSFAAGLGEEPERMTTHERAQLRETRLAVVQVCRGWKVRTGPLLSMAFPSSVSLAQVAYKTDSSRVPLLPPLPPRR